MTINLRELEHEFILDSNVQKMSLPDIQNISLRGKVATFAVYLAKDMILQRLGVEGLSHLFPARQKLGQVLVEDKVAPGKEAAEILVRNYESQIDKFLDSKGVPKQKQRS